MALIDKKQFDYDMELGSEMPSFALPGTDEETHSSEDFDGITVIAFWCNHCPYVKAADPEFQELADEYDDVTFVAINSNDAENYPEDSFDAMKDTDHNYIYLYDESQEVAKEFGAECTPHVFVFKDRELVYQGRVNDAGQDASSVSMHDLKNTLDDLRAGEDVQEPLTSAMGCSIKWK